MVRGTGEEQKLRAWSWVEPEECAISPTHSGVEEGTGIPYRPPVHGFRTAELAQSLDTISSSPHQTEAQLEQLMRTNSIRVAGPGLEPGGSVPQPRAPCTALAATALFNPVTLLAHALVWTFFQAPWESQGSSPSLLSGAYSWSGEVRSGSQTCGKWGSIRHEQSPGESVGGGP